MGMFVSAQVVNMHVRNLSDDPLDGMCMSGAVQLQEEYELNCASWKHNYGF